MDRLDLNSIGISAKVAIITKRGEQIDGSVALITDDYAEFLMEKGGKKYIARVLLDEIAVVVIPDDIIIEKAI